MRTVRCSGRLGGGVCPGVSALGTRGACLPGDGWLPREGVCLGSVHLPPLWTDRCLWKHYLSANAVADGNKKKRRGNTVEVVTFPLIYYIVLIPTLTGDSTIQKISVTGRASHENTYKFCDERLLRNEAHHVSMPSCRCLINTKLDGHLALCYLWPSPVLGDTLPVSHNLLYSAAHQYDEFVVFHQCFGTYVHMKIKKKTISRQYFQSSCASLQQFPLKANVNW